MRKSRLPVPYESDVVEMSVRDDDEINVPGGNANAVELPPQQTPRSAERMLR